MFGEGEENGEEKGGIGHIMTSHVPLPTLKSGRDPVYIMTNNVLRAPFLIVVGFMFILCPWSQCFSLCVCPVCSGSDNITLESLFVAPSFSVSVSIPIYIRGNQVMQNPIESTIQNRKRMQKCARDTFLSHPEKDFRVGFLAPPGALIAN